MMKISIFAYFVISTDGFVWGRGSDQISLEAMARRSRGKSASPIFQAGRMLFVAFGSPDPVRRCGSVAAWTEFQMTQQKKYAIQIGVCAVRRCKCRAFEISRSISS